ncbi:hypothetical protein V5799_030048 [Amblyomma americanum]|uniref:Uncharacterized protein n=1 Tax=Amblyomma americanum TaxID=6943 RepID=A0AAQ4EPX5_AMBAM
MTTVKYVSMLVKITGLFHPSGWFHERRLSGILGRKTCSLTRAQKIFRTSRAILVGFRGLRLFPDTCDKHLR